MSSAPRLLLGDEPGEAFGEVLASPGDVTGDGIADLVVGAPGAREGAGRVYLFSGADILERRALRPADAWAVIEGEPGWRYGAEVAALGDVDGDGWPDWGVGAPGFPGGDAPPGRLWVISGVQTVGARVELAPSDALAAIDGPNPSALMGEGFAGLGDLNRDGLSDFAVVHRDQDTGADAGFVHVILGRSRGNWPDSSALAQVREWTYAVQGLGDPGLDFTLHDLLAPAGDLDADGLGDLWVGLPGFGGSATRSGAVMLLPGLGASEAPQDATALALYTLTPDTTLLPGPDVVDAHLGQPLTMSGGLLWVGVEGPERGGTFGYPILGAGLDETAVLTMRSGLGIPGGLPVVMADLGGTGNPWTVLGTPRRGEAPGQIGSGRVAVVNGMTDVEDTEAAFAGFAGPSESGAGSDLVALNLDGDAYDDVLVGAPGALGFGAVYILVGSELADGDGYAPIEGDCDDAVPTVHPGALEISDCGDNLDNDCNGLVDEDDAPCVLDGSGVVVGCDHGASGANGASLLALLALLMGSLLRPRRTAGQRGGPGLGLALVGLVALGLPLSGCTGEEGPGAGLSITIVSPTDSERLPDTSVVAVAVEIEGGRLAPELADQAVEAPNPDEPQIPPPVLWTLTVDEFFRGRDGGAVQLADALTPGVHIVRAELVDTLGQPFDPPVMDEISVEIVAGEPTLVLTAPTHGGVVAPEGFEVQYDVSGFLLNSASIGGANQLGVGHARVLVDDLLAATDTDGRAFITNVDAGEHTLAVELVNNDGSSLSPVVRDEVSITVAEPSITILAPSPETPVQGPSVTLEYEVANFTLDPININGSPEAGRGHTHVYLDGLYQGLDASGTFTLPSVSGCSHLLRLELAQAGHAELGVSVETTFSLVPCIAVEALQAGDTVTGPQVVIPFTSPGHALDGTLPAVGGRYVTQYVDGVYVGFESDPGNATFTGVLPGDHVFELRLAEGPEAPGSEPDGELSPRVSFALSLTVQ